MSPQTEITFSDADFDAAFGAPAPEQAETPIQDVPPAADAPLASSSEPENVELPQTETVSENQETPGTVENEAQPTAPDGEPKQETQETPVVEDEDEKYAKHANPFLRDRLKEVKSQLMEAQQNSLQELLLTNEEKFLETVHDLSPSQFEKIGQSFIHAGIEQHSAEYAKHLVKVAPDVAAQELIGIPGITAAEAKRIVTLVKKQGLEDYIAEDADSNLIADADSAAQPAQQQPTEVEQLRARLQEIEQQQQSQKIEQLENSTWNEVISPVLQMLDDAGLKILDTDSPEVRADKEYDREKIINQTFDYLMKDPENKVLKDKVMEFIKEGDETSIKKMIPKAKMLVEDFAGQRVERISKARVGTPATPPKPPPAVRTTPTPKPPARPSNAAPVGGNNRQPMWAGDGSTIADAVTDDALLRAGLI